MSRTPLIVAAAALLSGVVVPSARAGESTLLERVEGTYRAVRSDEAARKRIDPKVEKVVEQMYFFKKPFARNQLQEATAPCTNIEVRTPGDRLSIQCDDRPPAVSPPDGTSTEYVDSEGENLTLQQRVESKRVVQIFESDRGTRTNVYRFEDDTMHLSVTLEGEALPEPITYERTFRRQS